MSVIQPKPSDLCIVHMHKSPGKHKNETEKAKEAKYAKKMNTNCVLVNFRKFSASLIKLIYVSVFQVYISITEEYN